MLSATPSAVKAWLALLMRPLAVVLTHVGCGQYGLASPDVLIDFGSFLFPEGTAITDQFLADGVTFGAKTTTQLPP